MDNVRLRTLTRKSIIGVGKYKNVTVQQLLDTGGKYKLAYVYYYYEHITFTPELLEEIGIFPGEMIEKPGINHDIFKHKMEIVYYCKYGDKKHFVLSHEAKKYRIKRLMVARQLENESKAVMQARNHGKIR